MGTKIIRHAVTGKIIQVIQIPRQELVLDKMNFARAGWFYNGEGGVSFWNEIYKGVRKTSKYPRIIMVVTQADPEVLFAFKQFIGCGSVRGPVSNGRIEGIGIIWRWSETNFERIQFAICCIWAELSTEKRKQAKLALSSYIKAKRS